MIKGVDNKQPIGIFDSGIGGLTVANAINQILPNEQLIYFGDTAHLPYGDKSAESIKHYSERITDFLLAQDCKMVIIACNTASSVAFKNVVERTKGKAIAVNVIDPVAEYVATKFNDDKVGVIGTKGTINSRIYVRKIQSLNKSIKVTSLATPLLAPMVEEGYYNNYISQTIIDSYLSKKSLDRINALILACTHYPLIKPEVEKYYQNRVSIIDSAEIVANYVKMKLKGKMAVSSRRRLKHRFYVSDFTGSFEKSTKIFFKNKLHLDEARIWD
ncbi:MAG: glutamate racemase [Flavobacteriales bacterium]|nr:glutamate racemase [Flavobacteriales bacterium]